MKLLPTHLYTHDKRLIYILVVTGKTGCQYYLFDCVVPANSTYIYSVSSNLLRAITDRSAILQGLVVSTETYINIEYTVGQKDIFTSSAQT